MAVFAIYPTDLMLFFRSFKAVLSDDNLQSRKICLLG